MVSLHWQDKMWTHPNSLCKITSVTAVNSHRWFHFVYKIQRELTPSAFARSHPWLPLVLTDDFTLLTGYHVNSPHQPLLGHISDCRRFSQMVSYQFLHIMWTNPISLCKVTSVTAVGSHRWLHSIFIFFLLLFYFMVIDHLTVTFWSGLSDICSFEIYPFMKRPMTCFEYMIMIVY